MSVEIQRTEVVLNNRGARGTSGSVLVSSATGQAVSSRMGLAAISSPAAGQIAFLTETGREGMFVFDSSNLTTAVGADPAQAIYVAPASATSGISGAWVRRYSGPKMGSWFGIIADGAAGSPTDNAIALQRFLDAKGWLRLPAGDYYTSARPIVRNFVIWAGDGFGFDARLVNGLPAAGWDLQPGTVIHYSAGVGGLDIQPQTTVTDVATAVAAGTGGYTQQGAYHSHISDIAFVGAGTGATATGVYSRSLVHLRNVHCIKFQGKGFDFSASSDFSDGNSEYGSVDLSSLTNCRAIQNGSHGFHIRGREANGSTFTNCWSQLNGGWGFLDESINGNTYIGGQAATNASGSYKCIGGVAASTYTGCYVEAGTGQAPDLSYQCIVNGGLFAGYARQFNIGTNGNPTINSGSGVDTPALNLTIPQANGALAAGNARVYRHSDRGLVLQGTPDVGGTYSHTLCNAADEPGLQLGRSSKIVYLYAPICINGIQVVGAQLAAVAAASYAAGAAPTSAEYNVLVDIVNSIRGRLSNHGLTV